MKSLPIRIISALVAVALLVTTYVFWGLQGMTVFIFVGCFVGVVEYSNLAFKNANLPRAFRYWFILVATLLMAVTLYLNDNLGFGIWGAAVAIFIATSLWILRHVPENSALTNAFGLAGLGFIYCAIFPMSAVKLLLLPHGEMWFLYLFFVSFAGDTFAYFGGILFGKKKLMPNISPNKTIAGSVFGTAGSVVLGALVARWGLPALSTSVAVIVAAIGSFVAQNGDLFESLLKRVAGVKDSGQIMPGHGGILDRLDGIYFAAPVVYTTALLFP